jgi:Tfp pilus assembly protein PilZ|tara:strand:+ start:269 stop:430 length:162 start_codon:yes stop_codon:yes gene_type:complete
LVGSPIERQEEKIPGIGVRLEDRENKVRDKLVHYLPDKESGKDKNKDLAGFIP